MTIWKELYEIFVKERQRWHDLSGDKQTLAFEIKANLTFLADGFANKSTAKQLIVGLEDKAFKQMLSKNGDFNRLQTKKLNIATIGRYAEFKKYVGKDTQYLINNAYARLISLKKLSAHW
ncbi:hypothetical protein [Thalassotalea agarivorans]|uniref:Uncharacterized protein n=1 Tax=Thalassotalea agarivorans TaxID=349064 RepID=A0A1I0GSE2_THASX|nr:hypothetical protein [Thalassotalea agarivorans]SET74025.1 hypothetical protein SAMN05660429_02540 [Thalassotalea agarivorans]